MNQAKWNADYQSALNSVFDGTISLRDKYLNPRAVIKHHCHSCKRKFFAKPLWLVNKRQPHECYTTITGRVKPTPKKVTATKKENGTPNKVTEAMKLEMIQLYEEGNSLKSISRKFSVTPPTVKRHIKVS